MIRGVAPKKDASLKGSNTPGAVSPTSGNPLPRTKPRILLVDMSTDWAKSIETAGYEASRGTFGTPLSVSKSEDLLVVPMSHRLPDFAEQEIVLLNLASPRPVEGELNKGKRGVPEWSQTCIKGVIDPRPLVMHLLRDTARRIVEHGGMLVVTATGQWPSTYAHGDWNSGYQPEEGLSPWSLLSGIAEMDVENEGGSEIVFENCALAQFLKRGAEGARYSCVLSPPHNHEENWLTLAKNKYGRDVAGMLVTGEKPIRGILILPEMPNLHLLAKELLEDWIADWNPSIFPHLEGQSWVHRREYEVPQISELLQQIETVKKEAEQRTTDLQGEIEKTRSTNPHWYGLLRGTDDELVAAVIDALGKCGFKKVTDVDKEAKANGKNAQLREDIQIHDRTPVLIVDVKGVRGHPDDDEARQAEKHATMRMREWKRTDVQPLTIINAQRHLPPDERDQIAYRKEIVENARDTGLGLMTTWDLFNILRNAARHHWPVVATQDIFYRVGRIDPVPSHYVELGKIVKTWEHTFGVVPIGQIAVGDTLAVQIGDGFEQIVAETLQVDTKETQCGNAGQNVGVRCDRASKRFRQGCRVFGVVL